MKCIIYLLEEKRHQNKKIKGFFICRNFRCYTESTRYCGVEWCSWLKEMFYVSQLFLQYKEQLQWYKAYLDRTMVVAGLSVFLGGLLSGGGLFGLVLKNNHFRRTSVVFLGMVVHFVAFYLIFLNIPHDAPVVFYTSTQHNPYLSPRYSVVMTDSDHTACIWLMLYYERMFSGFFQCVCRHTVQFPARARGQLFQHTALQHSGLCLHWTKHSSLRYLQVYSGKGLIHSDVWQESS